MASDERARSWIGLAIVIVAATVLQTSLMNGIAVANVKPDLMLALVVVLSLRSRWQDMFVANWVLGVMKDLTSHTPVGTYGVLFLSAGLLAGAAVRQIFGDHLLVHLACAFVAAAACECAVAVLMMVIHGLPWCGAMMRAAIGGAAYTALISPLLAWLMIRPARWLRLPVEARVRNWA